jgi:hypothetical protein
MSLGLVVGLPVPSTILAFRMSIDAGFGGVKEMGQPIFCSAPSGLRKRSPSSETKSTDPSRDVEA